MRSREAESRIIAVAERASANEIEPRSVMLFFLILSAFVALLALRSYLGMRHDSSAAAHIAGISPVASAAINAAP